MKKFFDKENVRVFIILTIIFASIYLVFAYTKKEKDLENQKNKNEDIIQEVTNEDIKTPMILEFGSDYCSYCVDMEIILDKIQKQYIDKIKIEKIDVYENYKKAEEYNIRLIPTQIFLDLDGKEIYRNEGILTENEIIEKLKEMEIK